MKPAGGAESRASGETTKTLIVSADQRHLLPARPALELRFALLCGGPGFVTLRVDDPHWSSTRCVFRAATFVVGTLALNGVGR
jgi:hypothetical protein